MTAMNSGALGSGRTDAELARAAAAGDRRAFAAIYDRYADRLHDFCIGMLRDPHSAADCVHDAFCTVATSLSALREPDKLRPWLYSIARHQALRRLRDRRREEASDDLPDSASHAAGPATLANRMDLANLVAEAAGGLADRDRLVLELAYRHGLDGPELADALGVSQTNANTMVHRLRDTIERCLGALLVSRRVQANPSKCPELAAILRGWDGRFTILMRKRIARHIESCASCERDRKRLVNPVALLGGAPLFIPAPVGLRDRTMTNVELTSSATGMATTVNPTSGHSGFRRTAARHAAGSPPFRHVGGTNPRDDAAQAKRRLTVLIALLVGIPLAVLGLAIAWMNMPGTSVAPIGVTGTSSAPLPTPVTRPPPAGATANPSSAIPTTVPRPSVPPQAVPGTTGLTPGSAASPSETLQPTSQPSAQSPLPSASAPPGLPALTPTPQPSALEVPPSAPMTTAAPEEPFVPPTARTFKPVPGAEPTFIPPN